MKDMEKFLYENHMESPLIPTIKEELAPYLVKKQGEFTIEDCDTLPDEYWVELIDGVIYDMTAPTTIHQGIGDEIREFFSTYIKKNKGKCITLTSPVGVQLDCDDKTMVQPDVLIICDRDKIRRRVIYGAPDLVVEVLSPSTRRKDIKIKTMKYMNAGVREYWIVDPDKKRVCVYEFAKEELPKMYTFEDQIPVGIFDGECKVDFSAVYEYVSFLYD